MSHPDHIIIYNINFFIRVVMVTVSLHSYKDLTKTIRYCTFLPSIPDHTLPQPRVPTSPHEVQGLTGSSHLSEVWVKGTTFSFPFLCLFSWYFGFHDSLQPSSPKCGGLFTMCLTTTAFPPLFLHSSRSDSGLACWASAVFELGWRCPWASVWVNS